MADTAPPGLIIHLGNKKTGSTSLQGFLARNEDALRGKGVNFVSAGRRHIAHNQLFRPMRGPDAAAVWGDITAEVTGAPDMLHLMSSEMFFDQSIAQSMAAHLPDGLRSKTRLVVYLRRQDAYLEAMYKQMTKNGRVHATPTQFVQAMGVELGGYASVLRAFEDVVGRDAIILRVFERGQLKNGDTSADFLDILGLASDDPAFVQPAHAANETLSRAATQLLGAFTRNTKMNAREIARELLRGDDTPPRRSGDVFRKDDSVQIMAGFAAENAAIAARYAPDGAATLFAMDDLEPDTPDPYPTPAEEAQLFADAQEKTSAAIGRIDARQRAKLFRG